MKLPKVSTSEMCIGGIMVHVCEIPRAKVQVRVKLCGVADAVSGGLTDSTAIEVFPAEFWAQMDERSRATFVRCVVATALMHELDEWLRIDGELVNKPHEGDKQ